MSRAGYLHCDSSLEPCEGCRQPSHQRRTQGIRRTVPRARSATGLHLAISWRGVRSGSTFVALTSMPSALPFHVTFRLGLEPHSPVKERKERRSRIGHTNFQDDRARPRSGHPMISISACRACIFPTNRKAPTGMRCERSNANEGTGAISARAIRLAPSRGGIGLLPAQWSEQLSGPALAARIIDLFRRWKECEGGLEAKFGRFKLLKKVAFDRAIETFVSFARRSPLTPRSSLLAPRYSPLAARYSLLATGSMRRIVTSAPSIPAGLSMASIAAGQISP